MFPTSVTKKKEELIAYLEQLGCDTGKISDVDLLFKTFIHKSFSADFKEPLPHNERLEFLGDAILGAAINNLLFQYFADEEESTLTLYKIALVREEMLATVGREIKLDQHIFLGHGEEKSEGRKKDVIVADGLEALIGFIFLMYGYSKAEEFVARYIFNKIDSLQTIGVKSNKTLLQEQIQKTTKSLPEYRDFEDQKDDKGNCTTYRSELYIQGEKKAEWFGSNKKKAQEDAARIYLSNAIPTV